MRNVKHIFILCLLSTVCQSQPAKLDSLQQLLTSNLSGPQRMAVYQSIITSLWLNYPDSARAYAQQAIIIAKSEHDIRSQAIAVRLMGGVYLYKGSYDSALLYSKDAYALSIESGDSTLIASSLNNIGFTHYHFGSYSKALENLLRSLRMKYKIKSDYGLGQTLNNIGLVYAKLKDYKKAREYFKEALRVAERTKDGNILLYSNNNIGFTYLKQQRVKDAETYFLKALEAAKSVNNTNWHATAFSGLAQVNLLLKNETTALQLFKRALAFREQIGDLNGISEIYYFLSLMNLNKIKIDSAFYYARLSQQIAIAIKARNRELENYELFKKLHQQNGRYDSALYYQEQFTSLSDSLFNENLARNLAEIQLSIQSEENNQVLAAKELALQRKAVLTNFLLVVILSVLTLAATIFWFYRKQRRLSNSLSQKNTEIMNQTEEITQQRETLVMTNEELERARRKIVQQNERLEEFNKDLQATVLVRTQELELANRALRIVNLELDNFIYKSSHDMKGPLARLLGICHVALMDVHDEKAREYFTMLAQTSRQLNDIFDRLRAVSDINSRELQKDKIFFDKIIEKVLDRLKSVKGYENMVFDIRVADDIDYVSDEFLIETIFYNMLENAIKFQKQSLAEGDAKFVKLRVKTKKKKIIASFTDNGIGIEHHETDHIFDMFSKAALKHQTVGLGLYIVKQSLTKINGSIALVKSDGERTKFEIELPYL